MQLHCEAHMSWHKLSQHKKVLLRERKRHTARCVANPWQGGTYLGQGGGVPTLAREEGYLPWPGGGGTYLGWEEGVSTLAGGGVPTLAGGISTYLGQGEWVPTLAGVPPPPRCGQTNKLKLLPSPILGMRVVTSTPLHL